VLEQEQDIGQLVLLAGGPHSLLEGERLAVLNDPEVADPQLWLCIAGAASTVAGFWPRIAGAPPTVAGFWPRIAGAAAAITHPSNPPGDA